jgi:hypothetical protein
MLSLLKISPTSTRHPESLALRLAEAKAVRDLLRYRLRTETHTNQIHVFERTNRTAAAC